MITFAVRLPLLFLEPSHVKAEITYSRLSELSFVEHLWTGTETGGVIKKLVGITPQTGYFHNFALSKQEDERIDEDRMCHCVRACFFRKFAGLCTGEQTGYVDGIFLFARRSRSH